jgi:amino acid transporter
MNYHFVQCCILYGAYFGFEANIFLIFFQGYTTLFPSFDGVAFVISYILIRIQILEKKS